MKASAPGCIFEPSEKELTDVYLHDRIAEGKEYPGFIHVADVYSAEPEELVKWFAPAPGTGRGDKDPVWYFFSPVHYASKKKKSGRRARAVGGDSGKKWHSEIGPVPVNGGSDFGGHKLSLTYMVRDGASGEKKKKHQRAGWILAEFGIAPEHGGGQIEVCKLHRSPRFKEETAAGSSKKRKAPAEDELCAEDLGNQRKNLCVRQEVPQDDDHETTMDPQEVQQEAPILDYAAFLETQRMYFSDDIQEGTQQTEVPIHDDAFGLELEAIQRLLVSDEEREMDPAEEDEDDGRFWCTYDELLGIDGDVDDDMAAAACESTEHLHVAPDFLLEME